MLLNANSPNRVNVAYLHITEAAPGLNPMGEAGIGKLISFLVSDFIKAKLAKGK
jgi:hypothetical protein